MALSGATPRRDIQRLEWDAGKPLAAAADLQSARNAVEGNACQRQQANGGPCVSEAGSGSGADGPQAAEHLGWGEHRPADVGSSHPRAAADGPTGSAVGARGQAPGLAAVKPGLIGCGGAEQPLCGAGADLTVELSAMEIRTFLVHLGDARDGPVEQDDPLAALHADA